MPTPEGDQWVTEEPHPRKSSHILRSLIKRPNVENLPCPRHCAQADDTTMSKVPAVKDLTVWGERVEIIIKCTTECNSVDI